MSSELSPSPAGRPRVSVLIPCRREAVHITEALESILRTEYPHDRLEVIVVDGMSDDGTRDQVAQVTRRHSVVRLLDNPRLSAPAALNVGLRAATGDVIVRMDAHTTYPPDYIPRVVDGLIATKADNVGAAWVIVPTEQTLLGHAVAAALAHPFGVGNPKYKFGSDEPVEVDTVPFGCMWRRRMEELGPFDERFPRTEDLEYNARIRAAGGRVVLLPGIKCYYQARSRLGPFIRHTLSNGYRTFFPAAHARLPIGWRHLVPLAFLLSLLVPMAAALAWPPALWAAGASAGAYALVNLVASAHAALRRQDPALIVALPLVFTLLHLLYGVGSAWGLIQAAGHRTTRR